ncbi:MAG: hypothetical protein HYU64_20135 [Armatimonadetes bacterium]|nr:hypothetical protein [Armatimonadota bacterium]
MKARKTSGMTMAELLVYCVVFSFCLTGVFGIFKAGKDSFEVGAVNVDLQGNALRAARQLGRELRESNWTSTQNFTTSPKGIIFVSPRNPSDNNSFDYNVTEKKIYWHKLVCYYIATNSATGVKALFRKEVAINATSANSSITALDAAHDTTTEFANDNTLKRKVISDYVDETQSAITQETSTKSYVVMLILKKETRRLKKDVPRYHELILDGKTQTGSSNNGLIRVTVRNQW